MKGLKVKEELPSAGEMERSGENVIVIASEELAGSIRPLIEQAKARVAQSVNSELVFLYWRIGKTIREEISARKIAGQEEGIVDLLSETLTMEYGRGFSRRNLFHMIRMADTFEDGENSADTVCTALLVPFHRNHLSEGSSAAPVLRRDGQSGALERADLEKEDPGHALRAHSHLP